MNTHHYLKIVAVIMLICILPIQGCADLKEINNIAIVTATGIDMTDDGRIKVTCQLFLPNAPMNNNTQSSTQINTFALETATGPTISEAVNNIEKRTSRQLFRAHDRAIIISRKMAKNNMADVLDYSERFREIRERVLLFVSDTSIEQLLCYTPFLEKNSGELLYKYTNKDGNLSVTLLDALMKRTNPLHSFMIPIVTINSSPGDNEKKILQITRTALFTDRQMMGTLSHELTYGPQIISNTFWQTVFSLQSKQFPGKLAVNLQHVKSKTTPIIKNGKWSLRINITGDLIVFENTTRLNVDQPNAAKYIENRFSSRVSKIVSKSVRNSQAMKSDIFNFYSNFYKKYPHYSLQERKHWKQIYPDIDVQIATKLHLLHSGATR